MSHRPKHSALASIPGLNRSGGRQDRLSSIIAKGYPYSRHLVGHESCINALTFSSGDGRFLASGGDDLNILLWDFHQEDLRAPACSLRGPRGNIFSLAFSATNRYLYSGGTDETILKYDIEHIASSLDSLSTASPNYTFRDHDDTIRAVSCHPYQDEVFLSAGQDGRILNHDGRASNRSTRAQDTLQLSTEATCVQFHPVMEHIFVTSDNHGVVCLRDTRMAFGPLTTRTRQGIVQTYNTKLSRKANNHLSNPETSSVTFDKNGTKLAVTMLHYYPTVYGLSDSNPLAVCSGRNLPDGTPVSTNERSYSNSCTIKHGSFGSADLDSHDLYSAGSEDFRGYVWKIPSPAELQEQRIEVSYDDWTSREWPNTIAFAEGIDKPRYIPVDLATPLCRLTGHKSIVNSVVFHPHLLHIVTSGVERDIVLHSPTPSSPCCAKLELTPTEVRSLGVDEQEDRIVYFRALAGFGMLLENEDSERATIMMFDHILREEGEVDVFSVRRWSGGSDSSDSEEEDEDDDDDEIEMDHGI
ncbi:DDB1- and CUL4-associated factor 5 [Hypsizygus marmoreus]|uniref:DDB1- and CUL4-associated factor 5 n=1 Tax=Hypsizygus marmoreus TaxID=39966 RepID=A0A369J279_HYPMA|nr:DDB1- and CUL4-associated factor 5 [Hypsizygus marmoreus]